MLPFFFFLLSLIKPLISHEMKTIYNINHPMTCDHFISVLLVQHAAETQEAANQMTINWDIFEHQKDDKSLLKDYLIYENVVLCTLSIIAVSLMTMILSLHPVSSGNPHRSFRSETRNEPRYMLEGTICDHVLQVKLFT